MSRKEIAVGQSYVNEGSVNMIGARSSDELNQYDQPLGTNIVASKTEEDVFVKPTDGSM